MPVSTPAWAPVLSGSYVTRYELRRGYDDLGIARGRFLEGDAVFYRLRFGIGTGLLSLGRGIEVGLQFTPQSTGTFGDNGPNTIADAQLALHEGYARVQGKRVRVDAGRYEMLYGDALMIGNNDWNEVGRTFDGVRARIGREAWLDLFANVIDEGRPDFSGTGAGDLYFVGAYAALGPLLREAFELDLYTLARVWNEAKDVQPAGYRREGAAELTAGARSKARFHVFDYRVEAGVQTGTRPGAVPSEAIRVDAVDVLAWQADLELGIDVDVVRVAVEALYASGARPGARGTSRAWQDSFSSGHKWLGLADAFNEDGIKRTNVASTVAHVTVNPVDPLAIQLDAHLFARPEATEPGGARGFAGAELDLGAAYRIARGLRVRALYCVFLPDVDLYPGRDPAHFFETELRYDLMP